MHEQVGSGYINELAISISYPDSCVHVTNHLTSVRGESTKNARHSCHHAQTAFSFWISRGVHCTAARRFLFVVLRPLVCCCYFIVAFCFRHARPVFVVALPWHDSLFFGHHTHTFLGVFWRFVYPSSFFLCAFLGFSSYSCS